ncbi:MAG: PIN domain-containing protein [Treponema sp.]|jgi:predicted nucleic-acid-binding protein|nr:PIN domain-containing protein [Treponema sp.]
MPQKTVMLDTNSVVCFLMVDDEADMFNRVARVLATADCAVSIEVIAEALYILDIIYHLDRNSRAEKIKELINIDENLVHESNIVRYACNLFASTKLDFIDCILDGYAKIKGHSVFTFDGDLQKQLGIKAFAG